MVNSSDEPAHIKEALSRLVVELIKREWPQNWGSLLPELNNIRGFGVHFTINRDRTRQDSWKTQDG